MEIDKNVFNYDGSPALVIFHIMFFISLFFITKINNKTILFQLLVGIFSLFLLLVDIIDFGVIKLMKVPLF